MRYAWQSTHGSGKKMNRAMIVVACGLLFLPTASSAQVRASEISSVSQTIDGTRITITGSRPRARNRDALFGHVVHWGEVWTPGANFATTLETSKPIKLNGYTIPQGKYSMWIIVREKGDWTMLLDTLAQRYHTRRPDTTKVAIKFPVTVQQGEFTEMLTWTFPEVRASGGKLALQWGTTKVAMDLGVEPSLKTEIAAGDAAAYVGKWSTARNDTIPPREFTITFANDTLRAEWDKAVVKDGQQGLLVDYMKRFALIPVAQDLFVPGLFDEDGKIFEVLRPEMMFQFTRTDGKAGSFEVRDMRDKIWMTGKRKD
jgi:hypothetical protein